MAEIKSDEFVREWCAACAREGTFSDMKRLRFRNMGVVSITTQFSDNAQQQQHNDASRHGHRLRYISVALPKHILQQQLIQRRRPRALAILLNHPLRLHYS